MPAAINLSARLGRQQTLALDATRWQTSDKDIASPPMKSAKEKAGIGSVYGLIYHQPPEHVTGTLR